jgi:hypothetical protein
MLKDLKTKEMTSNSAKENMRRKLISSHLSEGILVCRRSLSGFEKRG